MNEVAPSLLYCAMFGHFCRVTLFLWVGAILLGCGSHGLIPEDQPRTTPTAEPARAERLTRRLEYQVRFEEELHEASLEACSDRVEASWMAGGSRRLSETKRRTYEHKGGSCIQVQLELEGSGIRTVLRTERGISLSTAALFLRPRRLSSEVEVFIRVEAPPGYHVLGPWGEGPSYHTDIRALRFDGVLTLSKDAPEVFEASGARIRSVSFDPSFRHARAWIEHGLKTISQLWGSLPFEELHVVIVPTATKQAVRFGFATRGPVGTVVVMPGLGASLQALERDWVLPHELSHLLFPYIEDAWLSEGLATYYQEVLRARSGAIEAGKAWDNLSDGFSRGRSASGGVSLAEASAAMHQNHSYVHVYWSGAALSFMMDVRLRQVRSSLDEALSAAFSAEHYAEVLDADEVLSRLDQVVTGSSPKELCETWLASETFPPARDTLHALRADAEDPRARATAKAIMSSPIKGQPQLD